jgi:hypothetical protein
MSAGAGPFHSLGLASPAEARVSLASCFYRVFGRFMAW